MADLKAVLKSGQITQGEAAHLLRLSRVMVNRYVRKGAKPTGNNKSRYDRVCTVLAELIKSGKLPLSDEFDKAKRAKAVEKIKAFVDTDSR